MDLTPSFDPFRELIVRSAKARWHFDEIAALRARATEITATHAREIRACLHALNHNLPQPRLTFTHNEADRAAYIYLLMPRLAHQSELLIARDCNEALGKYSPYWNHTGRQEHPSEAEFHELLALARRLEVGNQSAGIANRESAIGQRTGEQEPGARATGRATNARNTSCHQDAPQPEEAPAPNPSNEPALSPSKAPTKHRNTQPNRDKQTRSRIHTTSHRHQTHRPWSINQALYLGALQTKSALTRRLETKHTHSTPTNEKTGPGGACLAVAA
jgi:hypothetical protein